MNIPREGGARTADCLLRNKGSPADARERSPSLPPTRPGSCLPARAVCAPRFPPSLPGSTQLGFIALLNHTET